MLRRFAACLLLCAIPCAARAQVTPPAPVMQALSAARIPAGAVAIVVEEVGATRPSLTINPSQPMNPASVMKLVTTYAALEMLGPAYRWRTDVYLNGTVREGTLEGDLVLRGNGDPKLDLEAFWTLLRGLRGKGLREIKGDLVLDRSRFERPTSDASRFDGDLFRPYNVLPDALLVNYKSLRFVFAPDPEKSAVRVHVEPRPPALEVINVLQLSDGACPEGSAFRALLKPTFEPARQRALFSGRYPSSCGERDLNVALLDPNDHVGGTFRQLWTELGGAWSGTARDGTVPAGLRSMHTLESPPLAEIVRDVNKFSNNIMARHLYLTLGLDSAGAPANGPKASNAVKAWLAKKGIAVPELVMENGSGLSRIERISAGSLANILQAAWKSPVMPEFISSMPVAGIDGTMRRRVKDEGVTGQAHIKTGLLGDTRAIAGYVLDRRGHRQIVVMIVNHATALETQPAMDALLRWVYER